MVSMNCLIRMLWIYLNRCPESATSTRKRFDAIVRTCFPANGNPYPSELPLEPFVAILPVSLTTAKIFSTTTCTLDRLDETASFLSQIVQQRLSELRFTPCA